MKFFTRFVIRFAKMNQTVYVLFRLGRLTGFLKTALNKVKSFSRDLCFYVAQKQSYFISENGNAVM